MKMHPLKAARDTLGWSQTKLAKAMGVSTKTVIRWEAGLAVPHPRHRAQLSRLFGKTFEDLGLPSNTNENDAARQVPSPVNHSLASDTSKQESLGTDLTTSKAPAPQQWLTNSLAGNFQVHKRDTQAHKAQTQIYEDHLFSHRPVRDRTHSISSIPTRSIFTFRNFSWFSRRSLLISSMILLTVLMIIAVPLAFNKLPFAKVGEKQNSLSSTSTKVKDHSSLPSYTLTIQNTDPALLSTVQHLQEAFNAVYPQLVNRFAFDPHAAKLRNVTLTISSDLASPMVTNGAMISINADWIQQHPTSVGLLTYGLTLGIEQYPDGAPSWFADGMADYARTVYGPADDDEWSVPNGVQPQNSYRQGGGVTARFLLWLEQHTKLDLVNQLNRALQTGQSFSDAFHHLTQQTVDDLWRQYQTHPDLIQTPEQIYMTATSREPLYQSSYDVQRRQNESKSVFVPTLYMSNFAMQADVTVSSGSGEVGFIFRNQNGVSYNLYLSLDGTYGLSLYKTHSVVAASSHLVASGFSSVINEGLHQTNRLTIVAQKHTIYLYINGQFITEVDNSSLSYGGVGVIVTSWTKTMNVRFENLQIF